MTAEEHKWKWYVPEGATKLIIGTFPTHERNWSFDFFYPNCANNFWRVLSKITNKELRYISGEEAILERKLILEELKLGVTDMGLYVRRHEEASVDHKLELVKFMDIKSIIDRYKAINKIILTSSSGKVSAYSWFCQYLKIHSIKSSFLKKNIPFYGTAELRDSIQVAVVKSTSPLAAANIDELISMYKQEIL